MASGLQVFDAAGRITLDVTDRVCKILGTVSIAAGSTGSVSIPELQGNQPFLLFIPAAGGRPPTFTVSNSIVSWYYEDARWVTAAEGTLFYGIY